MEAGGPGKTGERSSDDGQDPDATDDDHPGALRARARRVRRAGRQRRRRPRARRERREPLRGRLRRAGDRYSEHRSDRPLMSAGRSVEQQAAMQSDKNDVWGERRRTDPVLRAVINVLCQHTEVSYYTVDWRPFLFGATCPAEEQGLARGLVQDPDDICGSHSVPYNEGGGGYLERFAAGLGATAAQTGKTISQTILDELREDYDRECWAVSPDNERSHLGGRTGRLPAMTFEEILEAAHWTLVIFAAIDTEVERQRRIQEDIAVQARGGQLDLFAAA